MLHKGLASRKHASPVWTGSLPFPYPCFLKTNIRKTLKFANFGPLQSQFHPNLNTKKKKTFTLARNVKVTITVAKSVNVPAGAVFSGTCGSRSSRSCRLPSSTKRKLLLFRRFLAVHTFLVRVRRNWYGVFGWNWESTMFSYPQWKCWHVKSCLNRIFFGLF